MRKTDREYLRALYAFRCGYCGISEIEMGAELTCDHFQPRSLGGSDQRENWVYCCHACNEFKGDYWEAMTSERILHPLRDDLSLHIGTGAEGILVGLTDTGKFHLAKLQLNRPTLVGHRAQKSTQQSLLSRITTVEQTMERMEAHFIALMRRLPTEEEV